MLSKMGPESEKSTTIYILDVSLLPPPPPYTKCKSAPLYTMHEKCINASLSSKNESIKNFESNFTMTIFEL